MIKKNVAYIIANFGGPRNIPEVQPFLTELLTDQDVIRTKMPQFLHRILFSRVAKKRALKVSHEYESMGGKSPIYADTEAVAEQLRKHLQEPVVTFHRYLPATHPEFIEAIKKLICQEMRVFPMFPQFTYATTGSIARWFQRNLPREVVNKIRWVKSYPAHSLFIHAHQNHIRHFLEMHQLPKEETILLFSAHGIPQNFVAMGDVYEDECQASFNAVIRAFPTVLSRLSYQSLFGREEWLKPYTVDVCKEIHSWRQGRQHVVFVPISFTSDHIETLCEIERDYMSLIRDRNLNAYRVPALTLNPEWIQAILSILQQDNFCSNQMLIY
jgi:protoporphyrin/coproporphyrin ferrochelatase